jgi:uncharacterized protein (TIGR00730 family)
MVQTIALRGNTTIKQSNYQTMKPIERLAIFCGSKEGNNKIYLQEAKALALLIAQHKVELIYGGGKKGLMGCVADTVMEAGGIVRGVIPRVLIDWEHQHEGISELLIVDDMHLRKRKMYELCDAAIILPGGFGTLDELFEILTWNQLSIHDKKVFILNTHGFYNHLMAHLEQVQSAEFLYGNLKETICLLNEPSEITSFFRRPD